MRVEEGKEPLLIDSSLLEQLPPMRRQDALQGLKSVPRRKQRRAAWKGRLANRCRVHPSIPLQWAEEVFADLDAVGIRYNMPVQIDLNTRAKRQMGICRQKREGHYIEVSASLLDKERLFKDVLAHELLHTVAKNHQHGIGFQNDEEKINALLPDYHIDRLLDLSYYKYPAFDPLTRTLLPSVDVSALEEKPQSRVPRYKYLIECQSCHNRMYRQRWSKTMEHLEHYRCARCGGRLELYTIDPDR